MANFFMHLLANYDTPISFLCLSSFISLINFSECQLLLHQIIIQIYLSLLLLKYIEITKMSSPTHPYNSIPSEVEYEVSRRFMNYAGQQLMQKQNFIIMESNLLIERLGRIQFKKNNDSFQSDFCHFPTMNTLDTSITEVSDFPRSRKVFTRKNNNSVIINKKTINDQSLNECILQIKRHCSMKTYQFIKNLTQKYDKLKKNQSQSKASEQLNLSLNGIIKNRCQTDRNNYDQSLMLAIKNQKLEKQNGLLSVKIKQFQKKIEQLESQLSKKQSIVEKKIQRNNNINRQEKKNEINDFEQRIKTYSQKIEESQNKIINLLEETFVDQGCNRCCILIKKIKDSLINYKNSLTQEIKACNNLWERLHSSVGVKN